MKNKIAWGVVITEAFGWSAKYALSSRRSAIDKYGQLCFYCKNSGVIYLFTNCDSH